MPLLRGVAEAGYSVRIMRLPYRFAPFDAHREEVIRRARGVVEAETGIRKWVVAGHSKGAKIASEMLQGNSKGVDALLLIASTHPRDSGLDRLQIPVKKIFGSEDGIAPREKIMALVENLPPHTQWVEIQGANHSQFGHYGSQLFDGTPTISREEQQRQTRVEILKTLKALGSPLLPMTLPRISSGVAF